MTAISLVALAAISPLAFAQQVGLTWDTSLGQPGFDAPVLNFWTSPQNTLHAMGEFTRSGGVTTGAVAVRSNNAWQPLGTPLQATWVESMVLWDSGQGPQLHVAGGGLTRTGEQWGIEPLMRLVGNQWLPPQTAHPASWSSVIAPYRVQGVERLFVCGPMEAQPEFLYMSVSSPAGWTIAGGEPFSTAPQAMLVANLGDGERLYFAGGAGEVASVGSFDGQTWRRIGGDVDGFPRALAVLPTPTGNQLLVGGWDVSQANIAGPGPRVPINGIALWTGTQWDTLSGGVDFDIYAIAVAQTIYGPRIFAGGEKFLLSRPRPRLSMYENGVWIPITGLEGERVDSLHVYDADGPGPAPQQLLIGGSLTTANGTPIGNLAALTLGRRCDTIDFNRNSVFPEDQDVVDFFTVLAGGSCQGCGDIDFNNNSVFPEDQDVIDFFAVLAGGSC
ncbi:MAG TPA: hypothetical protein VK157_05330 [Phycisphaerales bacterium]|nr:hypothetical protein [Phycisphaerales bacterium]